MGILDNKTRIFDTIFTNEGKRQLANGKLRLVYASFTDGDTFYEGDISSGSTDPGERIYFEAMNLNRDQITFEADDSGILVPYEGSDDLRLSNGLIMSGASVVTASSAFASIASSMLTSSIDSFKNQRIIGSADSFETTRAFELSTNEISFSVTNTIPLKKGSDIIETSIDDIESFFQDKRLGHLPNFQYLPPETTDGEVLADYGCTEQEQISTYSQLKKELKGKGKRSISFSDTSRENNIIAQIFEVAGGAITKLDVIDYGEFQVSNSKFPIKRVFFAGKVFVDTYGNGTFVNLFTLVFD